MMRGSGVCAACEGGARTQTGMGLMPKREVLEPKMHMLCCSCCCGWMGVGWAFNTWDLKPDFFSVDKLFKRRVTPMASPLHSIESGFENDEFVLRSFRPAHGSGALHFV